MSPTTSPAELFAVLRADPRSWDDHDVSELLTALRTPALRDAALADLTGHPLDAADLASGGNPALPWLLDGPLDRDALTRARQVLDRLEAGAGACGREFAHAPVTIRAYIDWATGSPSAAARRLTTVPTSYALAGLIRHLLAIGLPGPHLI